MASPRRLVTADRLILGQHALDDDVGLHPRDQRLGGGEGRVKGRLPHHAPVEGDCETAHRRRRREKEIGSEVETRAGLDAQDSALAEGVVDVVDRARYGQLGIRHGNDLGKHLLLHRLHAQNQQVAGRAHRLHGGARGIGELRMCEPKRFGALVHLRYERIHRAGVPVRQREGEIVC